MMWLRCFFISFIVFSVIDLIWLGIVAQGFYQHFIGHLMRESPFWPAAFLFYFFFILGLMVFVIQPAIQQQSTRNAFFKGAFFGFITYMTYELTNWAVLNSWPAGIVLPDILWGMLLCSSVSYLSTKLYLHFFN